MPLQSEGRCREWPFREEVEIGMGGHMAGVVLGSEQPQLALPDW